MDYSTLNDETLIVLITRTQSEALSELYNRYNRIVFSVALNVVGDGATAEEVMLDVFTSVWQKAASYRPGQAKVGTWLTSIARYRAIDALRRRSARPEQHNVSWADAALNSLPNGHNPEESAALAMQQERVRLAVAQLPPEQRQAMALAFFKGYTHRQIAETLGQPLGTVKTRIRLAMNKLRQLLAD